VDANPTPPAAPPAPTPPPPHAAASPTPIGPELAPSTPGGALRLESHDRRLVRLAAGFYGIATLFALGYAGFSGTIGTVFGEETPGAGATLAAVVLGLGIVGLSRLGARVWPRMARAADALGDLLGPLSWGGAIVLALMSGFAEELLFRGALWPHLGLFGTTLLFGLVHFVPKKALWGYPLFALAGGFLLGLLRRGGGSVFPPMLAHAIVNALNLAWIGRRRSAAPPVS
jgi:membrane protease YdiL (CAAX protease family)